MQEERKDQERSQKAMSSAPEQHVGVLKDKEKKELENQIVVTLKSLSSRLTKKEILALMNRIEANTGLEWLRNELEKEKKLENTEISDETLRAILDLFREVEHVAESGLQELKLELSRLNESKVYDIDKTVYLTNKFPWIKLLEESELGKNIIIDIAGIGVGAIDSVHAILKFLLTFIKDLVLLPRDIAEHIKNKA